MTDSDIPCQKCDRKFISEDELRRHRNLQHTSSSMGSFQTSITLRKARVINHEEIMTNELSKQIISKMEKQMQKREDMELGEMEKAISMVREVFKEAERALDLAFAAGVLASKVNGAENHTQDLLAPT